MVSSSVDVVSVAQFVEGLKRSVCLLVRYFWLAERILVFGLGRRNLRGSIVHS